MPGTHIREGSQVASGHSAGEPFELRAQQLLATTLMGYARSNPDRIRGRLMPVIVYDPQSGRRAFTIAMEKLAQP